MEQTKPRTESIGARFSADTVTRIAKVAERMAKATELNVGASNVIQICVRRHLPELERQYGVEQQKEGV